MGKKQRGQTVFTLVIRSDQVRVRKAQAPVARPMVDLRRKGPRHRTDHLADE